MKRILEVDAGNSRLKWRLVEGGHITQYQALAHDTAPYFSALADSGAIDLARIGCVAKAPVKARIEQELAQLPVAHQHWAATAKRQADVLNSYECVGNMGVDRWLAMLAAYNQVRDAVCVVDCGTAITADFISATGRHEGGYIFPGPGLLYASLQRGTGQVAAAVSALHAEAPPGDSTQACVDHAISAMVRGVFAKIHAEQLRLQCGAAYITGGDGEALAQLMGFTAEYHRDLVLDGLAYSSEYGC